MQLHYTVGKPPDVVFDYLSDMQKFASVHPVISKIETTGPDAYLVHEKLKMGGFIPVSFTYPSFVECDRKTMHVVIRARVKRMVDIEVIFDLNGRGNSCEVVETVSFKTRLPFKRMIEKIFKKQHARLFSNIEAIK